jgi:DNA repair exonuclease SbcCD ATPase subunit
MDLDLASARSRGVLLASVLEELRERAGEAERLREASRKGGEVVAEGERWSTILDDLEGLSGLLDDVREAEREASREVPDPSELDELHEEVLRLGTEKDRLDEVLDEIDRWEDEFQEMRGDIGEAEEEFEKAVEGRCPLCGSEASPESLLS